VEEDVKDALATRPKGDPTPKDDSIFASLADATVLALSQSVPDYALAIAMFNDCYEATLEYEHEKGCEVHKGAPTFNVGVSYLRTWDFSAAMHYFELSQKETRRTYGEENMDIFLHDLFVRNYWDTIDIALQPPHYPVAVYNEFWKTPFRKAEAIADWKALTNNSKILFIISLARRIRERQLERQSHWNESESLALAYWTLAADLSRLLETETRASTGVNGQMHAILSTGLQAVTFGTAMSVSTRFDQLHGQYGVNDTATFNAAFPTIKATIENPGSGDFERVCQAVYLLYATRNQVAHKIDAGMVLFTDIEAAKFTTDVLLTLCRLGGWTI
jgi:hypothetical protein